MGSWLEAPILDAAGAAQVFRRCMQGDPVEGLVVLGLDVDRRMSGLAVNARMVRWQL